MIHNMDRGTQFDMLTVIKQVESGKDGKRQYLCRCSCGNTRVVKGTDLRKGRVHSCGCTHWGKKYKNFSLASKSGKRLYGIWYDMKRRCEDPRTKSYARYGARGIIVCAEWHDFQAFYDWALSNGYSNDLTLDRVDFQKGYTPTNCRWADLCTQANNRRNNHFITYHGETKTMVEWSRECGIPYSALRARLRRGWSPEKAIEFPLKGDDLNDK